MFGYRGSLSWYGGTYSTQDKSQITPSEKEPEIVTAAKDGDLETVQCIVEEASTSQKLKIRVVNKSRRRTEVQYKATGINVWQWHDLTPLSAAALHGHDAIVEYLLRNFADPTLAACTGSGVHFDDALHAAEQGYDAQEDIDMLDEMEYDHIFRYGVTVPANLDKLMRKRYRYNRCIELLQAVDRFWSGVPYSGAEFSEEREHLGFLNKPTSIDGMLTAINKVPNNPPTIHDVADVRHKLLTLKKRPPTPRRGPGVENDDDDDEPKSWTATILKEAEKQAGRISVHVTALKDVMNVAR